MRLARESCRHRRSTRCATDAPSCLAEREALEVVVDRLAAHRRIGVAQAAELVGQRAAPADPGTCSSSWSRRTGRAIRRRRAARRGVRGVSHGMCSETPGVTRTSRWTTAQSSSFSKTCAARPGPGSARIACRRCPRPTTARRRGRPARAPVSALDVDAAPRELRPRCIVVILERRQRRRCLRRCERSRGDMADRPCRSTCFSRGSRSCPRANARASVRGYRGNAARLPASTFRMLPVDFADRSEAKKYTASATSSGKHAALQQAALPVEVLDVVFGDAVARRALGAPRAAPDARAANHRVGVDRRWRGCRARRPSTARQRARCSAAALAAQYAEAPGEATSAFLLPTKTMEPPRPWRFISAERLARDEEIAGGQDVDVALPHLQRRLVDAAPPTRCRRSTPGCRGRRTRAAATSNAAAPTLRW